MTGVPQPGGTRQGLAHRLPAFLGPGGFVQLLEGLHRTFHPVLGGFVPSEYLNQIVPNFFGPAELPFLTQALAQKKKPLRLGFAAGPLAGRLPLYPELADFFLVGMVREIPRQGRQVIITGGIPVGGIAGGHQAGAAIKQGLGVRRPENPDQGADA